MVRGAGGGAEDGGAGGAAAEANDGGTAGGPAEAPAGPAEGPIEVGGQRRRLWMLAAGAAAGRLLGLVALALAVAQQEGWASRPQAAEKAARRWRLLAASPPSTPRPVRARQRVQKC